MNITERQLLFALADGPANFAQLSFKTLASTEFLNYALCSLVHRGFVEKDGTRYQLATGVRAQLVEITEGTAVIT